MDSSQPFIASLGAPGAPVPSKTVAADPATTRAKKAPTSWLDYEHPEFTEQGGRWGFAWDFYTGAVLFEGRIERYLVQRASGESDDAFAERCRMAEYTNHFATVVDSLVGMLAASEKNAKRTFYTDAGAGLGDPTDPTTVAGRLMRDATGDGEGWLTLWKRVAAMLFVLRRSWLLVDTSAPGVPIVRPVFPVDVKNWRYDPFTGALVEATVSELADARESIRDEPNFKRRTLLLSVDGWSRWEQNDKGEAVQLTGEGNEGRWKYVTRGGSPTVPLVLAELPIARDVGFSLAKKAQGMFNKESERDHLLRYANFPRFLVDAPDDTTFKTIISRLTAGANVVQGAGHKWTAPDAGPATIATEVLKRKVEEFYIVGFREYGDAGREKTATEVRQDVASGLGAILSLAKDGLDNAENDVLFFVEQTVAQGTPARWGVANVVRSSDFAPLDEGEAAKRLAERTFGTDKPVPMGVAVRADVARRVAAAEGLEVVEPQALAASRVSVVSDALAAMPGVTLPAKVKAQVAVDVAIAAGYIDGENEAEVKAAVTEAETAAAAAAEAVRRMTEAFPGNDPAGATDDDEEDEDEDDDEAGGTGAGAA